MTLSEIINELKFKESELKDQQILLKEKLDVVRQLAKESDELEEKVLSIGFAIKRLVDIQENEMTSSGIDDAWGGLGG